MVPNAEDTFDADVIVVGGGPVGAVLVLALAQYARIPLRVTLLEAQSETAPRSDTRTLALSHGSRLILERVGVWRQLQTVTPITRIHISQRGSLGRALLSAEDVGLPALGYVIGYAELQNTLWGMLRTCGADYRTGAQVSALLPHADAVRVQFTHTATQQSMVGRLAVLADGGRSLQNIPGIERKTRDYQQCAVVCQVSTALPHRNLAYERFTDEGPAALLPSGADYALIWTTTPAHAPQLLALSDADFLRQLQAHFGDRQGAFLRVGKRNSFALSLQQSNTVIGPRLALIGNAAQMLHPVAGQGFNMGLRDAWELAQATTSCAPQAIGARTMLQAYAAGRRMDTHGGVFFTDLLVRGFSNRIAGLRQLRGLALSVLDALPPVKAFVVRRMIFGAKG